MVAIVFLEAWRQRKRVELRQPSALPWLYGVAANVLRHERRSRRRYKGALDRLAGLPERSPALVERQAQAAADADRVIDQVRGLPHRERDALVLSVWEGLLHAEIAVALDISVGTVKS
ncbi:MAG TPA: sigma-70 family RNA polymerase sigma factor, partial [Microthrixaceae bacterium]|nr:sigma-70 family RNA polymerase sigma factor [Microthrixaceae bacterium]